MSDSTRPFFKVICGEMFACGDDFLYLGVHTTLKPWNETFDVFFDTEWVLSRSFLASAPSRVFERIDIWSLRSSVSVLCYKWKRMSYPKIQASSTGVTECPCFGADYSCDFVYQVVIESRCQQYWGSEGSSIGEISSLSIPSHSRRIANPVERFRPPIVWWKA